MKHSKQVKKLEVRIADYERGKASAPGGSKLEQQYLSGGFHRPGSVKK